MKGMRIILSMVLACMVNMQTSSQVHLTGKVKENQDALFMMIQMTEQGRLDDTIRVAPDGSFDICIAVTSPGIAYLLCEEPKASAEIFVEDKMNADLQISFAQREQYGEKVTVLDIDYSGDNKDCFDYNQERDGMRNYAEWPWEKLSVTVFSIYRKEVEQDIEERLGRLFKVKSDAFRKMMSEQLEHERFSNLCRWAWAEHKEKDADFERWILSFDHNDIANMDKIGNYWRWFSKMNMPPRNERSAASYYDCLKKAFTNQEIINYFADDFIQQILKDAPEDMDEQLAAYKVCSTNPKGYAEADKLYAHYSKLKKGAPAADFDFYDKAGKKYTLKDFRGKALYIDCWATWCGPCCMEIPHMEKLYAHYKNSKKVELISISLDDSKQKWEKKIAADKPGWRQFIVKGNFKSQLCQNYDIDAIPRFLMFDKRGNIISLDAPRPSDPKIIKWIDSNLK